MFLKLSSNGTVVWLRDNFIDIKVEPNFSYLHGRWGQKVSVDGEEGILPENSQLEVYATAFAETRNERALLTRMVGYHTIEDEIMRAAAEKLMAMFKSGERVVQNAPADNDDFRGAQIQYDGVIRNAKFEKLWGLEESVVVGEMYSDRKNRFPDGTDIHTSAVKKRKRLSDGSYDVTTRNSRYHVFLKGNEPAAAPPSAPEIGDMTPEEEEALIKAFAPPPPDEEIPF